jgi:integrase
MLFSGFYKIRDAKNTVVEQEVEGSLCSEDSDVWRLFLYAMKSRDKYQRRLSKFFEFAEIQGTSLQTKALSFIRKSTLDSTWIFTIVLRFLEHQNSRVNNREICGATVRNYVKAIKLFCEMADLQVPWKKLTRGLPRAKSYSDDRIPSLEELRKLLEYPDRRIKAIVCTMASSGIRLGAWASKSSK